MSISPFRFGTPVSDEDRGGKAIYDPKRYTESGLNFSAVVVYWALSMVAACAIYYLSDLPDDSARSVFISSFLGGLVLLPLGRTGAAGASAFRPNGGARRRTSMRKAYLISNGDDATVNALVHTIMLDGVQIVGSSIIQPEQADDGSDRGGGFGGHCDTLAADVEAAFEKSDFSEVYIRLHSGQKGELEQLTRVLAPFPVRVALLDDPHSAAMREQSLTPSAESVAGYSVVELCRPAVSTEGLAAKRALDIVVASAALLVLLPIIALSCAAIAVESGRPVIFRQNRKGAGGRQFTIFKLRTMNVQENGNSIVQARRNDPRVTPLGAVFRKTSIDELPQFWNVLRGDMSIVGPRPHALAHDTYYGSLIDDYARRHNVKPGLTGWAQVNGLRGETRDLHAMAERVRHDIWYIENWSLWLDIKIIIKTVGCVFFQKEAY